ncbi:MAG: ABC transporter permease [Alphaproteobacteria bacterium]|nr:ABC transporter permease [Alphaproteobacteria bacterium]
MTAEPTRRRDRAIDRFLRHRLAVLGMIMTIVLVFFSVVGPYLLPFDDLYIDVRNRFAGPFVSVHLFGTDQLGRDLLARLMMAGRISMSIGFSAMVMAISLGTVVGAVAGYYGGAIGATLMRLVDAMLCFPSIFLLLALAAFTNPGVGSITVIIALTSWMEVARIVEGQVKSLRERDFAVAAELMGGSDRYIIFRELLPNAVGPIVVAATLNVANAILMESYVSFLGYGIQPPTPSWGNMLNNAQQYLVSAPWLAIFPGLAITAAVTSFNFIGDGLRDAFDPRLEH